MAYVYPPPSEIIPPPCPECGHAGQVGELEASQHLGGGEWMTYSLWVCGCCGWIVATQLHPATTAANEGG